ncbi:MAG: carbamoyltransferase HypF [Thermoanaerobaculia bacterium]
MNRSGRRIEVRGTVQGVGFRPWVYRLARESGLAGRVSNDSRGVTIEAFGTDRALDSFLGSLRASPPPAARIGQLDWSPIPAESPSEFVIVESRESSGRRVSIPADLPTCGECLREVFDPRDRRYRYPFTNCTNCGPRFTIARDVPYDRPATTMAAFRMCSACRREYEDPSDRRFHAQPNACPACGPRLTAVGAAGEDLLWADPIRQGARALEAGLIVAVKGIGGFHLACDATCSLAVRRLRDRKKRDEKPFAVMVRDLEAAGRFALLRPEEEKLLTSSERPIVLLRRREECGIAEEVAPRNPWIGLLLPYSPLHHLLLSDTDRPLVMTSGNSSGDPIVHTNAGALEKLGAIADVFLLHDREIESPCDDSVARVIAGRSTVLRRSRGYVPRAIPAPRPFARPVLACGGHLKNTFCLAAGEAMFPGPHIGDLESLETVEAFEQAVSRLERFVGIRPEIVAHDLHPEYATTLYARSRAGAVAVGVQHHHAHVASAMAEHGLEGPVLGVAYDGTGYGTDGTAWGGEILLARYEGFERLATWRPIPLPGGETAIREVWRIALALLEDAYAGDPPLRAFPLFDGLAAERISALRRMASRGVGAPLARGVGRYFDAFGALFLHRSVSRYEGQVALEWNAAADVTEKDGFPFAIERDGGIWTLDWRPAVRAAVDAFLAGRSAATISGRFHNTVARATADLVRAAAGGNGGLPVVLTGGCFQNALLSERVASELEGHRVALHGEVPPGDGGLAVGQALVAGAIAGGLGGL